MKNIQKLLEELEYVVGKLIFIANQYDIPQTQTSTYAFGDEG
ncbi:hypothetical protein [Halobacillus sp. B23F22_1]